MKRLQIRRPTVVGPAKHVRGAGQQLLLPFGDLGGMDAELLRQLRDRLITFTACQRHMGLERISMIPSRSFHCLAPLVRHHSVASMKSGYHLSHWPNFRSLRYIPQCHHESHHNPHARVP